jgi:hypothetical protein
MCLSAVTVARWRGPRRRPRQSPPLVHVRVYRSYRYSHSGEFISSRQSDDDTVSPPLVSRLAVPVGRAAVVIPTGGRIATGRAEPRSGEGGGAKAEAGNMEGDGGRKRAVKTHEHFDAVHPHAMRVSMPRSQHTVSLSRSRLARGQRLQDVTTPTRVGTAVGRGRVGTVGVTVRGRRR